MRQIDGLTNDGHGVGGVGNVAGDEKQEDGDGDEDGDAERHLLAGLNRQTEDAEQDRRQDNARAEDVHEIEHELAAHVDRAVDLRKRLHQVVLVDDVRDSLRAGALADARLRHHNGRRHVSALTTTVKAIYMYVCALTSFRLAA